VLSRRTRDAHATQKIKTASQDPDRNHSSGQGKYRGFKCPYLGLFSTEIYKDYYIILSFLCYHDLMLALGQLAAARCIEVDR
jgi:hypothetical protein